jgi:hypothetical protein
MVGSAAPHAKGLTDQWGVDFQGFFAAGAGWCSFLCYLFNLIAIN